jgi:SAM-dependent methyltransferase
VQRCKNKNVLELGCGFGDNGNNFTKLNCNVTSTDIRKNFIDIGKQKYPYINFNIFDAENEKINKFYDIIVDYSLSNHLKNFDLHLIDVCKNCNYLFLELEVSDDLYDDFIIHNKEHGEDQSFYKIGSKPTEAYVERILSENNFNFKIIKDNILNTNEHKYDWCIENTNKYNLTQSRYWICWKNNIKCPIKEELIEKVSIILQGKINKNIDLEKTILNYQQHGRVILSLYRDFEDINYINYLIKKFPNIYIINNNYIEYENELKSKKMFKNIPYLDNCYYQIKTSLIAFRKVISKYVIKTRLDHYYGSIDDFIRCGINQKKIISSSVFVRGVNYIRYHLSDHIFGGTKDEIYNIFKLAFINYNPRCPEINIWKPYIFHLSSIEKINLDKLDNLSYAKWMAKKFYIYCINQHFEYKLPYVSNIVTKLNDNDKTKKDSLDYFLNGCDC